MGWRPAQSWTKAENCDLGFSASFPAAPSPSSTGLSVALGPHVVVLELHEVVLAIGRGWWPAQAPLGSSLARPDSRSTSLSSRSTSARFFSRAPRWDWSKSPDMLDCSRRNWGEREDRREWHMEKERGESNRYSIYVQYQSVSSTTGTFSSVDSFYTLNSLFKLYTTNV